MRTLVVSDMHLGERRGRARLHAPPARERLVEAARAVDRLVLLGDVVELRERPIRDALADALPVLAALGAALDSGCEVVVVPGNHDHSLLSSWRSRRELGPPPEPLGLATELDWRDGELLAVIAAALATGGANVRASYPGIWLRDDVYATHGHYLDHHTTVPILERLSAAADARVLRRTAATRCSEDYEAVLAPIYAWIDAVAQARQDSGSRAAEPDGSIRLWQALGSGAGGGGVRRSFLRAGVASATAVLNRAGLGPLHSDLSAVELRRASLRAFVQVLDALGVSARYAIHGHSHRAGPLPGDELAEWRGPAGARVLNSGCWVTEAAFLGPRPEQSPYRAGFAVVVDGARPPELVNLLDVERAPELTSTRSMRT